MYVLAQALVLGRIHLFGYATPMLYVYFVAGFERNYPKWGILLWSFMMGLSVDILSNTPGMAAASLTAVGALQPYYFELFVPRDSAESLKPTLATLGPTKYSYYIIMLVFLFCLIFYTLELFTFLDWIQWLLYIGGSTAITLLLIFTFEIYLKR